MTAQEIRWLSIKKIRQQMHPPPHYYFEKPLKRPNYGRNFPICSRFAAGCCRINKKAPYLTKNRRHHSTEYYFLPLSHQLQLTWFVYKKILCNSAANYLTTPYRIHHDSDVLDIQSRKIPTFLLDNLTQQFPLPL